MPLSPESFCPLEPDRPIIPCRPDMIGEGHRALSFAASEIEMAIANLRRRALELGLDVFAQRVGGLAVCLREAREDLVRCPR